MKRKRMSRETRGKIFHGILVAVLLTLLVVTAMAEDNAIVLTEKEVAAADNR